MEKILNISDLEKYRIQGKSARYSDYLVPQEWFENFPECKLYSETGIDAQLRYVEDELNKGLRAQQVPQDNYMYCYIHRVDEIINDGISGALYCNDFFAEHPDKANHPVIETLRNACLTYNGWKAGWVLVSLYSSCKPNPNILNNWKENLVRMLVTVNSWTDVVTNSSSEIFICSNGEEAQEIENIISKWGTENEEFTPSVEVKPINFAREILNCIFPDYIDESCTYDEDDLISYGLPEGFLADFIAFFKEIHNMDEGTCYEIIIDQWAQNTADFVRSAFGAQYWSNC